MKKFDYKTVYINYGEFDEMVGENLFEKELKALGQEGWELVTADDDGVEIWFGIFKKEL
jgi:hypothetical protein